MEARQPPQPELPGLGPTWAKCAWSGRQWWCGPPLCALPLGCPGAPPADAHGLSVVTFYQPQPWLQLVPKGLMQMPSDTAMMRPGQLLRCGGIVGCTQSGTRRLAQGQPVMSLAFSACADPVLSTRTWQSPRPARLRPVIWHALAGPSATHPTSMHQTSPTCPATCPASRRRAPAAQGGAHIEGCNGGGGHRAAPSGPGQP